MSRLINCLNGIDERVSITISDNEQIGNIIITIMKKLEEKSEYTIELHRELVEKELIERGFTQDIIQIWIDSIE
jgi:SOS response regulatory protein OraA/RecX